ncbi:MAG TPA: lysophospholipase [Polyangiaceae bacterium]|nr:lysophospholipase [Polyangiaceae bacterium]
MSSLRFLDRPDQPRLAWRLDVPSGAPSGRVLLIHGYADHLGRFDHVAMYWTERGLAVARLDLRGHGQSEGSRGHVMSIAEYVGDVQGVLSALEREPAWTAIPSRPILFGHSLGALIAAEVALEVGDGIAGFASTSPFFAVKQRVHPIEYNAGKIAQKVFPKLRQSSRLHGTDMTHDPRAAASYDRDEYHFGHITMGFFFAALEAQNDVLERARAIRQPLFCIAAGEDRVVDVEATKRFFERAGSSEKELDVRPGLFHEILNETDWRDHAGRLADRMRRWSAA